MAKRRASPKTVCFPQLPPSFPRASPVLPRIPPKPFGVAKGRASPENGALPPASPVLPYFPQLPPCFLTSSSLATSPQPISGHLVLVDLSMKSSSKQISFQELRGYFLWFLPPQRHQRVMLRTYSLKDLPLFIVVVTKPSSYRGLKIQGRFRDYRPCLGATLTTTSRSVCGVFEQRTCEAQG